MPWVGVHVDSTGGLHPCCRSVRGESSIKNNSGQKFNLVRDKITDFSSSNEMLELKHELLNNAKPKICENCWFDEKIGKQSFRESCNAQHADILQKIANNKMDVSQEIEYLDLQVGNRCNQKCRMCDPYSSSGLARDQKDINNYTQDEITFFTKSEEFTWPQKDIVWKTLIDKSENIKFIKLWGGEAFLEKQTLEFLIDLISRGLSENIELFINTNGHALQTNFLDIFSKFKKTNLMISIDGEGSVNEYIRFPSKWSKSVKEIDHFINWTKQNNIHNVRMSFNCVFQLLNLFNIPDLLEFLFSKFEDLHYKPEVHVNFLSQPFYLSSQVAPQEMKKKATTLYNKLLNDSDLIKDNEALKQNITAYIKFINEEDRSDNYPRFLEVNKTYDKLRKQSLSDCIPEVFI
jgi:organic radical activating enzyme